eukprot:gnl/MRDRNA2_/MRDRNA2_315453_c0_seq1.p1 gnl/MRDRNA2_/MRDRNA2_315453_c0~~gnl/MRDRNA2_/MRDRNA2_315453_c0_seq1.p1  ORF type:complete len:174 (+),score=25.37 gnl/MRDRNA2_/MRDRNA2_315453_c0_seq1:48-524(+)
MALAKLHNAARPGLWIVEGQPVFKSAYAVHNDGREFWEAGGESSNFLHLFCKSFPPGTRMLAVLDVTYAFTQEFVTLVDSCNVGALVTINTNIPNGIGYVRDHLLSTSNEWAEVLRWQETILSDFRSGKVSAAAKHFLRQRSASVLQHRSLCSTREQL